MDDQANSQSSIFSTEHALSVIRQWPTGLLVLVAVPVLSLLGAVEVFVAGIIYRAGGANPGRPVRLASKPKFA